MRSDPSIVEVRQTYAALRDRDRASAALRAATLAGSCRAGCVFAPHTGDAEVQLASAWVTPLDGIVGHSRLPAVDVGTSVLGDRNVSRLTAATVPSAPTERSLVKRVR